MAAPAVVLLTLVEDGSEFKRRIRGRPQHNTFRKLVQEYLDESSRVLGRFTGGEITAQEFADEFGEILAFGHSESFALGRQRAGDYTNVQPSDIIIGRRIARQEKQWLHKLKNDLENGWGKTDSGKYDHNKVMNRLGIYLKKFRGTANMAFVSSSDDSEEFDWLLGRPEKHCSDCPAIAARSPYRKTEISRHPGNGSTPCLSNCYCRWRRRSDGVYGFNPILIVNGEVKPAKNKRAA